MIVSPRRWWTGTSQHTQSWYLYLKHKRDGHMGTARQYLAQVNTTLQNFYKRPGNGHVRRKALDVMEGIIQAAFCCIQHPLPKKEMIWKDRIFQKFLKNNIHSFMAGALRNLGYMCLPNHSWKIRSWSHNQFQTVTQLCPSHTAVLCSEAEGRGFS